MSGVIDPKLGIIELSGVTPTIQQIKQLISQIANTDVNVMINGESGTGKEIVARLIHFYSKRSSQPFVPVNCGAIPLDLLESELFGHEKGAFTGAVTSRLGRFELAEGGTIFLDEIGDMPLSMQIKILRVIQEKQFERVGSNKSIKVNVRIIAATHRDLEKEITRGNFREDLYYRLNVFPLEIPSLRERKEDIPLIINDLIMKFKQAYGSQIKFTEQALNALKSHSWAGNIRELSNLVERLIVLYPNQLIDADNLPKKYQHSIVMPMPLLPKKNEAEKFTLKEGVNLKELLNKIEIAYIKEALAKEKGVVSHAAEILGMRRTTLVEKMKKYDMAK